MMRYKLEPNQQRNRKDVLVDWYEIRNNLKFKNQMYLIKINKIHKLLLIVYLLITSTIGLAEQFLPNSSYEVCFCPRNNCADKIIKAISEAKKEILVQAYSFTDTHIAHALIQAKNRGVGIEVMLDKNELYTQHSVLRLLERNGIKVLIDYKPAIAHNKVIILDRGIVLGGSYNYSKSANKKNAENLLLIKDTGFAQNYLSNWYKRRAESVRPQELCVIPKVSKKNLIYKKTSKLPCQK